MIRLVITIAILFGAAGCASSARQVPESASPAATPGADDTVAMNSGDEAVAPADANAGADNKDATIEGVEAPQVVLMTLPAIQPGDEVVCRNEALTGSHRVEEVCRLKSDVEQERLETRQALRRLMRQGSVGR